MPFLATHAEAAAVLHARCFPDAWPAHAFTTLLQTGAHGFVELENDNIIGLIMARSADDEAEILTFAVDPGRRNDGIGTRLLLALIAALGHGPALQLYLEVAEDNLPALEVYRRVGFEQVGERAGYYRHKGNVVTALILAKRLDR